MLYLGIDQHARQLTISLRNESGDVVQATRRLENLATRLREIGQEDLAVQAHTEARRIKQTHTFSEEGRMALKFGTRSLMTRAFDNEE